MKVVGLSWALATLFSLVACETEDGKVAANPGSETHWLTACDSQGECGEGQCVCGVCTRACSSDASCADLGVDVEVECRTPADEPGCDVEGAPDRVCLSVEAPLEAGASSSDPEADAADQSGASPDAASSETAGVDANLPEATGAGGADGAAQTGGSGGTSPDTGAAGGGANTAADSGGPAIFPFPVPGQPSAAFCEVASVPPSELCGGAAICPIVMAMGFQGTLRGLDAGLDAQAHAVVTSDTDVCLLSAAPGATPSALPSPFALPEDALANVSHPIAVDASGTRHVFVSGESAAVHYFDEGGTWSSETLTVAEQLDVRVYGAAFDDGALDIVYSAHLPDPGSAYNQGLIAGRSNGAGAWETVTLWEGGGELMLDAVYFPVGGSDPSAHWYASRDEEATLHGWRRSAAAPAEPTPLEYPWDVWNPVGRLATGEAMLGGVETTNYPTGPLHIGLVRDDRLVLDEELPDTQGEPYRSGCPVVPGTFMFGGYACMGHAGEACTMIADRVGWVQWANTEDGSTWLAYAEEHLEWDITLAERCVESEIDSGCTCDIDPNLPSTSREHITTTLARVSAEGDEIVVDVRLRLDDSPHLLLLDAQGSTLVFGFEGSLVGIDTTAL